MNTLISNTLKVAVFAVAASTAFAQPFFTLTELPVPAGYDFSAPYNINDQGYVVGFSERGSNGEVATVWKGGVPQVVGRLDKGTYSIAMAINSKGTVVGDGDDGDFRPLSWIQSGGKLVNFFSNNGGNTHALAINDAGLIGGFYIKGFSSTWRPAIWKIDAKDPRKSIKTDLPLLPGSDSTTTSSESRAFNQSMQAVGYCANSVVGQRAVFWNSDAAHTIFDLGVFGFDWSSDANSLNDVGQAVGSSHPPFGSRAILWNNDPAHTAYELPLLPGDNYGTAQLINNQGIIVGSSAFGEPGTWNIGPSALVIWINGQAYDLQSVVRETADGWRIAQISSINNLGQLAGLATKDGAVRGVILNPIQ